MTHEHEPGRRERAQRWTARGRAFACGLVFSALMTLAFAPFGLWGVALIAAAPLIVAARLEGGRPRTLGVWAGLGTAPFWAQSHLWLMTEDVTWMGLVFLVAMLSAYPAVFVWIGARVHRRLGGVSWVWAAVVVYSGLEALRALVVFDGYPWFLVGHPLIDAPGRVLSWPGAYVGALGVSALAAMTAGLGVDLALRRFGRAQIAGGVVLAGWIGLGPVLGHEAGDAGSMRVAVVQTNVAQDNKIGWTPSDQVRDFARFVELTRAAAEAEPDLIVWPETMAPGRAIDPESLRTEQRAELVWEIELEGVGLVELRTTELVEQLLALQRSLGVPMLIGAEGFDGLRFVERDDGRFVAEADATYNSAFIVTDGRAQEPWYSKVMLTPFGEVMPYISAWPWLEAKVTAVAARGMAFDLSTAPTIVRLDTRLRDGRVEHLATPICFEATMPGVCRRLVFEDGRRQAGLMVNLTNDGWFGAQTRGRRAHLLSARWRCVELGTGMVRAANTGISCVIDARGRVVREGVDPVPGAGVGATGGVDRVDGILIEDVMLASGRTIFARIGDLAGWTLIVGLGLVMVLSVGKNRGRGPKAERGQVPKERANPRVGAGEQESPTPARQARGGGRTDDV